MFFDYFIPQNFTPKNELFPKFSEKKHKTKLFTLRTNHTFNGEN